MFIMSGAHIVEICSAVMVYGYSWLGKQVEGLERFMDEKGYKTVSDMWGIAADAAVSYAEMPREFARVNPEYCNYCKRCLKACFYRAMQNNGEKVWVQEDDCVGCGGCFSVCPTPGAIDIMIHQ
jgi:NAD-dependent dihydropyrimidine dehydrogenase PreA subunit